MTLADCFAPLRYARNDSLIFIKKIGILFFKYALNLFKIEYIKFLCTQIIFFKKNTHHETIF